MSRYLVDYTVCFDRPELRGATYPKVAPGLRRAYSEHYSDHADAVARFRSIADGHEDFSSEYVSRACVYDTKRRCYVRRPIERARRESRDERFRQLLRVAAARRPFALWFTFHPQWACEMRARRLAS